MEPGREMDRLVAKHVMGWEFDEPTHRSGECQNCGGRWGDAPSHGRRKPLDNEWYRWCDGQQCHYSANDTAAWSVVRGMWERGWDFSCFHAPFLDGINPNSVCFVLQFQEGSAIEDAFPHAVCEAALRALGVEAEDE